MATTAITDVREIVAAEPTAQAAPAASQRRERVSEPARLER
jgi:hypothetical protein